MCAAKLNLLNRFYPDSLIIHFRYVFRYDVSDGEASVLKLRRSIVGCFLATAVVLYEAALWAGVLVAGMVFIATRDNTLDIIQATMVMTVVKQIGHMGVFIFRKESELAQLGRYRTEAILYPSSGFVESQHRSFLSWDAITPTVLIFGALAVFRSMVQSC